MLKKCSLIDIIGLGMLFFALDSGISRVKGSEIPEASDSSVLTEITPYNNDALAENQPETINQVFQLRDLTPEDWSIEALQHLIKRYNCIQGYPDGSYQGANFLTRYEFAAGLNACLETIQSLINNQHEVDPEDLQSLQKLVQTFETELAILRGKVDGLQSRVIDLERSQFAPTTKLNGNVIFGTVGLLAGNETDQNVILGSRTRLDFDTTFTGKDLLKTRLQADGIESLNLNTSEGSLAFTTPEANNNLVLDALFYQFLLGDNTQITLMANGGIVNDFANRINFLDGDGDRGALSRFGTRQPFYYQIADQGLGIKHRFNDLLDVSIGYTVKDPIYPSDQEGFFNSSYGTLAQIVVNPSNNFQLGFSYIHTYNQSDTGTGSNLSNFRQFTWEEFGEAAPTISNSYSLEFSWLISDRFVLGGWGGYGKIRSLSTLDGLISRGDLTIWNWALTLAFPDLGKKGNLAGFLVGVEPQVVASTIILPDQPSRDRNTSFHIEAFYQHQINKNITLTPGVIWLTSPNNNQDNNDIVIGTVRTSLSF